MSLDLDTLDQHIERLRQGDTLTENEVRALCEKVRCNKNPSRQKKYPKRPSAVTAELSLQTADCWLRFFRMDKKCTELPCVTTLVKENGVNWNESTFGAVYRRTASVCRPSWDEENENGLPLVLLSCSRIVLFVIRPRIYCEQSRMFNR